MGETPFPWFPEVLSALIARRELSVDQIARIFDEILSGRFGEPELAAFLVAMRMKGESAGELAAGAAMLRCA